jgi:hypothetical protein
MSGERRCWCRPRAGELGVVSEDAAGGRLQVEVADLDLVDEAVPVGERLDPLAWATLTRELDLLVSALQVDRRAGAAQDGLTTGSSRR